nr:RecName: Full=Fibrinogen beta chain; Contains: RecName: Full=Fibrinopeptide B [Lama glama]P68123.1 RecName: Full=Fibrinogen beta chain; Contains: RecName: Full=Fibrinopeptide B [Camelus dromedarius]P68124.1 RecName: Full=Fibrinogen beta chain; Contains: RecName: Full=Fibrinopeptide B [Vicugna vicugna]prf//650771AB fibrinopeptide B [Lama glama]prf//670960J fibrinopeptide B [Vicugna vicugna]
ATDYDEEEDDRVKVRLDAR